MVTWVGLQCVAVVFPDPTYFLRSTCSKKLFTVKPVLSGHSKIVKTNALMANGSLMKVKSIAKCSHWSILQYFWPALIDSRSWKQILVFFLSGRLRQVLLYLFQSTQKLCITKHSCV